MGVTDSMTSEDRVVFRSAEIISVGTELLIGQIVDTNARFLSVQLSEIGISTYRHVVVGDNADRLEKALRSAVAENDLVITTGGLGPTEDDITNVVTARVAGIPLVSNKEIRDRIDDRFQGARYASLEYPLIPEGSLFFHNDNGTAPGSLTFFQHEDKTKAILMLPGPPDEMEPMFLHYVRSVLESHSPSRFVHRYVRLTGIGESRSEQAIRDLIDTQGKVTIAPYANPGEVVFRVSQRIEGDEEDLTERTVEAIKERLGEFVFEVGSRSLAEVTLDLLLARGETCAFAESCTAGLLASTITTLPGASGAFLGGFVTYSDDLKIHVLGVPSRIIETDGAVSEACAISMAERCRVLTSADYGVAITGIAGPSGGTPDKPVGTVFIALAHSQGTVAKRFQFHSDRDRIRKQSVAAALNLLRKGMIDG